MSGTSADGIDVALTRITPTRTTPKITFLGHQSFPYPKPLRQTLLRIMAGDPTTAPELSRLHWRLGHPLRRSRRPNHRHPQPQSQT